MTLLPEGEQTEKLGWWATTDNKFYLRLIAGFS